MSHDPKKDQAEYSAWRTGSVIPEAERAAGQQTVAGIADAAAFRTSCLMQTRAALSALHPDVKFCIRRTLYHAAWGQPQAEAMIEVALRDWFGPPKLVVSEEKRKKAACPGSGPKCPAKWFSGAGQVIQAFCIHGKPLTGNDLKSAFAGIGPTK